MKHVLECESFHVSTSKRRPFSGVHRRCRLVTEWPVKTRKLMGRRKRHDTERRAAEIQFALNWDSFGGYSVIMIRQDERPDLDRLHTVAIHMLGMGSSSVYSGWCKFHQGLLELDGRAYRVAIYDPVEVYLALYNPPARVAYYGWWNAYVLVSEEDLTFDEEREGSILLRGF